MSLRILGGKYKNRLLNTPKGEQTRPSLGIVRKSLFDILQQEIEGSVFLDLFAGSGAIGFEALSRGARQVTFVDSHKFCVECLYKNAEMLGCKDEVQIMSCDVNQALKMLGKMGKCFDLIYIDPPYGIGKGIVAELLVRFDGTGLLKSGGYLFLEEGAPAMALPAFVHLKEVSCRTFSQTVLHEFRHRSE
jgi:16S rRNA (guanine(966)-N(2))-methyltransferase RsmD